MKNIALRSAFLFAFVTVIFACNHRRESHYTDPEPFNDKWEFRIISGNTDPEEDTTWQNVMLPHTPRIEPLVVNDQWQGQCEYRKSFNLPEKYAGKKVYLKFEGAMNVAKVIVNGEELMKHDGGYLPFLVDFSNVAHFGEANTVNVRLDNTDNPLTGPKPLDQLDFNTYGGIYRDVYLIVKDPLHITDPIGAGKVAGGGVFVTYPWVSKDSACLQIKTHVENSDEINRSFTIRQELFYNGRSIAKLERADQSLNAGENSEVVQPMVLENPNLWSPHDPQLYTLITTLVAKNTVIDQTTTTIGIRHFDITKEDFKINGEKMFLRGVNRHQEYPYIGYALSNEAQYRDAQRMKDAGFDYVRLSHYPQDPAFMDACDKLGLLVLDAVPGWQYFNEDPRFQEYIWQTCRDLIRRDRNHPSVLAWEVSLNESWMPEPFIDKCTTIAHEEYPGDQCFTAGWQYYGYDIYLQARQHRLQHYKSPQKPYIVSEYGDWEYYAMNAGLDQDKWSGLKQEERSSRQLLGAGEKRLLQQVENIQEAHNDNLNTPAFADGYWVMFDYNRGYSDDLEASGIMSINRLPKFSYYFFKSQCDPNVESDFYDAGPMVFIASYWTPESTTDVKVFSNCDEVELYLNGALIARQKPDKNRISDNLNHPPFTFHLNQFEEGTLMARGFIKEKPVAEYAVTTPGKPNRIELTWCPKGMDPRAGVNDAIFVYAKILDAKNNVVHINDFQIEFTIVGDAELINPVTVVTEAGFAAALVRVGDMPGEILLEAEGQGLMTGEIKIEVKK